jgi:putative alpha-1,2-mannosidase
MLIVGRLLLLWLIDKIVKWDFTGSVTHPLVRYLWYGFYVGMLFVPTLGVFIINYLGKPEKAQKRINEVFETMYTDKPDGVCGNEDVGQMSAWYVMAAMGLYQVEPCGGVYQLSAPLAREVSFNVAADKTFTIRTKGKGRLVRSWKLNGKRLNRTWITHEEIMAGGVLEAELKKK